jgi:RNA polymerase sigma factor (sigma-70 family)
VGPVRIRENAALLRGKSLPNAEPQFGVYLAAARAGSGHAFGWLYNTFSPRVFGYLRAQGAAEPDELTNDVFASAFRSLAKFDGDDAAFRSWLFTIARNRLVDERRRAGRRAVTVAGDAFDHCERQAGGDVEVEALENLAGEWVRAVLAQLAPDQRDVLVLRLVADLTIDQIATIVDKRPGAVKALQRRGLAALRKIVIEQGVSPTRRGDV